jgi:hypothetical protein
MTDEYLNEIMTQIKNITNLPWGVDNTYTVVCRNRSEMDYLVADCGRPCSPDEAADNAIFIANAPMYVGRLVLEVQRLRDNVAELKAQIENGHTEQSKTLE